MGLFEPQWEWFSSCFFRSCPWPPLYPLLVELDLSCTFSSPHLTDEEIEVPCLVSSPASWRLVSGRAEANQCSALYVQGEWGQTGGGPENHRGDYFFIWKPGPIPKNSYSVGLGGARNSLHRLSNNKQPDHFSNANLALLLVVSPPPLFPFFMFVCPSSFCCFIAIWYCYYFIKMIFITQIKCTHAYKEDQNSKVVL